MTPLEQCQDALDHIVRICGMAHKLTKRLYWIQARAQSAIDCDEKWREYDYPRNRAVARENLRARMQAAKVLLKLAKCPNEGCSDGVIDLRNGNYEQCEWCADRKVLLG